MKLITLTVLLILVACGSEPEKDTHLVFTSPNSFDSKKIDGEDPEEEKITWIWDSTKKVQLGYQLNPTKFKKGDNQTNILKIRIKKDDKSIDMTTTDTTKAQPKMTCCGYQPKQDLTFTETTSTTSIESLYFHMEGNWDIFVHVKHGDKTYKFTINTEIE